MGATRAQNGATRAQNGATRAQNGATCCFPRTLWWKAAQMPSTSYSWLLLVAAACNCLVVQSAKCTAGEFQVTDYTNEWTVSDATGTSSDGTAQPKVAVNMTIPIYFSAACTMSFFRNDIGLETDQITELSVTGGFSGSVQQLQSTQYTYDGSRFIKFFFPNSPMTVTS